MKDKNGIKICCENCDEDAQRHCANWNPKNGKEGSEHCVNDYFSPSFKALEARIAELQEVIKLDLKSVNIDDINDTLIEAYEGKIKELEEDFCTIAALLGEIGQERDKLREEVKRLLKNQNKKGKNNGKSDCKKLSRTRNANLLAKC